ncbi:hypothetical protein Q7I59_11525, partial [Escherichia coli]
IHNRVGGLGNLFKKKWQNRAVFTVMQNRRFQFFNWLSGLLWVSVVTSFGYALSMIPFVKRHEDQVMTFLMILPIALLTAGLLGTLFVVIKKKYCNA